MAGFHNHLTSYPACIHQNSAALLCGHIYFFQYANSSFAHNLSSTGQLPRQGRGGSCRLSPHSSQKNLCKMCFEHGPFLWFTSARPDIFFMVRQVEIPLNWPSSSGEGLRLIDIQAPVGGSNFSAVVQRINETPLLPQGGLLQFLQAVAAAAVSA